VRQINHAKLSVIDILVTHELSEKEQALTAKLQKQFQECRSIITQAPDIIKTKEAEVIRIQGAINGMAVLIATQQGLIANEGDTVKFDDGLTTLTITAAPEEPAAS
jgi:hypothetical protein